MRLQLVLVWLLVVARIAYADDKPWAAGVSDADQQAALALYKEGNDEFAEQHQAEALAKYREAIKRWDHPMIRFNMAVSLMSLDEPLEAYDELEAAMKYGAAGIGDDAYAQARAYRDQLDHRLAVLHVSSNVDDSDVTLDGIALLHGKGEADHRVLPGTHQVVATKRGFLPQTEKIEIHAGERRIHVVVLAPIPEKVKVERVTVVRRVSAAPAWVVSGGGAAMMLAGGILHVAWYKPNRDRLAADTAAGDLAKYRSHEPAYDSSREVTVGLYVAGALALGTGIALRYTVFKDRREVIGFAPTRTGGELTVGFSF